MRILLIEDNARLVQTLRQSLTALGMTVDVAADGVLADEMLRAHDYDAAVLDLALPRLPGLDVLQRLRTRGNGVPVLILTASCETGERVRGLNAGADDYLAKPFDLSELEARLRALHRRHLGSLRALLQVGDIAFDTVSRVFTLLGERLVLPPREAALLELLVERVGQPVAKAQLADRLRSDDAVLSDDAVELYVHRLRRRLDGSGTRIVTLRGLGYVLEATPGATA